MKRRLLYLLVSFLPAIISSCNEDEKDPPCGNSLSVFTGTWNITEHCGTNEFSYPLTITQNAAGGLTLTNLGGDGPSSVVNATVSEADFTIHPQDVLGNTITGNGSLNGGCVQLVYSWAGSPKGNCTATGSK